MSKNNNLDLIKIINDFLFLWVENPEEKAKHFFLIKKRMTPHGLEKYMQYYFMYKKWYKVKLNWRTNQIDWGIDLLWIKKENGKEAYIIAQCKRYWIRDINGSMIRDFWWALNLPKYTKYADRTIKYYITTSKFTYRAREYGNDLWIHMVDFYDLYKLQEFYSFEEFQNDILNFEWEIEKDKCVEKEQLHLDLENNIIKPINASDRDVFELLRQIRRDYSNIKQLNLWNIARNDTLEILSRERPHNMEALKKCTYNLSKREKNKILKHWNIFIERLKYIQYQK